MSNPAPTPAERIEALIADCDRELKARDTPWNSRNDLHLERLCELRRDTLRECLAIVKEG